MAMTLLWVAIGVLFAAAGAICGWLLGLTGFVEVTKGTDFKNSLRLKNFQYLIAGLVVTFAADYRKVGLGKDFPSVLPTMSFAFGAMVAYFATVQTVRASIRRIVCRWNQAHSYQIDVDVMLSVYDARGKLAFDAAFSEKQQQLAKLADENERNARRARHIEANKAIALCTYSVLSYSGPRTGSRPANQRRSALIDAILDAGCAAVRAHARRPDTIQLRGSFMRFVQSGEATKQQRDSALFTFDSQASNLTKTDPGRYQGFLELQHGAGYAAGKRVLLPVESAAADKRLALPGAPEAARNEGFAIMNVKPTDRWPGIPPAVWDEIDAFFGDVDYCSITSICVRHPGGVVGVMNVESSERDLLGEDREAAIAACATLQPIAALLYRFFAE